MPSEEMAKDPQLKDFSGFVQDSGEGRWTVEAAIEEAVPVPIIAESLLIASSVPGINTAGRCYLL